ncbi:transposase [Mesorhizobium sp. SARCC-RB16n]|uniref:transposase n=1 Tax=Mesorhizobium sp. SARCC-RB16n TaxID=2116687 RepID=UPI00122ECD7D|nr:transposase [Mesorhizobium sp. SARCC-RB16n]KAA3451445.1 transposase [Mesorhizobium sp. SARCC-RB16n]
MRRQTRPFVLEVKRKRGIQKQSRSIWGNFDISAALAETNRESGATELRNCQTIDSSIISADPEHLFNSQAETPMPDPNGAEAVPSSSESPRKTEKPKAKRRVAQSRKSKPEMSSTSHTNGAVTQPQTSDSTAAVRSPRKAYSAKERVQKLSEIEKSLSGGATLKIAAKQAGISEQTYYQWKRASTPAPRSDDLKDLLALEDENKRLKALLAERLRKENSELKKKLGLV